MRVKPHGWDYAEIGIEMARVGRPLEFAVLCFAAIIFAPFWLLGRIGYACGYRWSN